MKIWSCVATRVTQRKRFYHSSLHFFFLSSHSKVLWNPCCVVWGAHIQMGVGAAGVDTEFWLYPFCPHPLPVPALWSRLWYQPGCITVEPASQPTRLPPHLPKQLSTCRVKPQAEMAGAEPGGGCLHKQLLVPASEQAIPSAIQISTHIGRGRPPGYSFGSGFCDAIGIPAMGGELWLVLHQNRSRQYYLCTPGNKTCSEWII